MIPARWQAAKALRTRTPPAAVRERPDARLVRVVNALKDPLDASVSLGDPAWHRRWDGALQLVGLDASNRSVCDLRQRLLRLVHECALARPGRRGRVLAVVLCRPREGEGLAGWLARLEQDDGKQGRRAWRAARRCAAVLALDAGGSHHLLGGDRDVERAVAAWAAGEPPRGR